MVGSLIYVMGPSGAGKDTLMDIARVSLAGTKGVLFAKRYITRKPGLGGEDFWPLSQSAFDYLEANGHFLFSWHSHGLSYGCDRSVEQSLGQGMTVIVNGSRAYLPKAMELFPDLKPVLITAGPEILAARLKSRGRETAQEQAGRLSQPDYDFRQIRNLHTIDNSGELKTAAGRLCSFLSREIKNNALTPPQLSPEPQIDVSALVINSRLGHWTEVGPRSELEDVELGDYSYVRTGCKLVSCRVGKFANIANNVRVNPSNHPYRRPSLHLFTYYSHRYGFGPDEEDFLKRRQREQRVLIEHDVWIGQGAIILSGVKIGSGAIVAAGAVVSKNVEPYSIVGGIPAKFIKPRFPQDLAEKLMDLSWWDWERTEIQNALPDFRSLDISDFVEKYYGKLKCRKLKILA